MAYFHRAIAPTNNQKLRLMGVSRTVGMGRKADWPLLGKPVAIADMA
jgi:hypothetical protein